MKPGPSHPGDQPPARHDVSLPGPRPRPRAPRIGIGSWVVHPEHGFSQVWDVFDLKARQELEEKFDPDVVLIANGTALRYVHLGSLVLADMGEVSS